MLCRSSIALSVALAALGPVIARAHHDHATHAQLTAPVPTSRRWVADANLRVGMARIHAALGELRGYENATMETARALDRVARIEQAAAGIFAKCTLAPAQDAVLHGMLVRLLAATQAFKADPSSRTRVAAMRRALAGYPRYFDDPGWANTGAHDP